MKLTKLVKLNRAGVKEIKGAKNWRDNQRISNQHVAIGDEYRNRLLKHLEGNKVSFKGYVVDEFKGNNFTVACVEVYYQGSLIDTLHHVNLFADILLNHKYCGMEGKGNYSISELRASTKKCVKDALVVEGSGTVFSYGGKYSIGTDRQIAYTRNKH